MGQFGTTYGNMDITSFGSAHCTATSYYGSVPPELHPYTIFFHLAFRAKSCPTEVSDKTFNDFRGSRIGLFMQIFMSTGWIGKVLLFYFIFIHSDMDAGLIAMASKYLTFHFKTRNILPESSLTGDSVLLPYYLHKVSHVSKVTN